MGFNMKVTPEIEALTKVCEENSKMDVALYGKYDVKSYIHFTVFFANF